MSKGPVFSSVVYVGSSSLEVYTASKEGWQRFTPSVSLESSPPSDLIALTQGGNVLVLVSDIFAGHLQIIFANKKDQLTDEHLGQVLRKDYDIDLETYEFASQRFPVTRDRVQMSVSGIEKSKYQEILEWIRQLMPKKIWIMPFGWFVSSLKSVEPVLLAVVRNPQEVLVSHHYLGVDDAREITLADLAEYSQARKEERKETHLLYLQSSSSDFAQVEKDIAESLAVHPLLPEHSDDILRDVIAAVMEKGGETLSQQLHFEEDAPSVDEMATAAIVEDSEVDQEAESKTKSKKTKSAAEKSDTVTADEAPSVADLPKPTPPAALAGMGTGVETETEVEAEVSTDDVDEVEASVEKLSTIDESEDADVVEEEVTVEQSESDSEAVEPDSAEPMSAEASESVLDVSDEAVESSESVEAVDSVETQAEDSTDTDEFLKQLTADKVKKPANEARYREVESNRRGWGPVFLVFVVVVILTSAIGGAIFWSQQMPGSTTSMLPNESPTPTATPSPTPTPSPEPTILPDDQKAELEVAILNATGQAGLAGRYATGLKAVGWTDTTTGNATGEYGDGVFIYTTDDAVFETLSQEITGVKVNRMTTNTEKGAASANVIIVINDGAAPKVVEVASPTPTPSASPSPEEG